MTLVEIIVTVFGSWRRDALLWCKGKPVIFFAIWPAYFSYILLRHLIDVKDFFLYQRNDPYSSWFHGINFGIHELGHPLFSHFGTFLAFMGGSFLQCLLPFLCILSFLKQRHYFGVGVMGVWLATNFFSVGVYMADSRVRDLPLVGLGNDPQHDWEYMFSQLGLIWWDTTIAFFVFVMATVLMVASILFLSWLCYRMHFPLEEDEEEQKQKRNIIIL